MTQDDTISSDHTSATTTSVMWCGEHVWNFVYSRVHILNTFILTFIIIIIIKYLFKLLSLLYFSVIGIIAIVKYFNK